MIYEIKSKGDEKILNKVKYEEVKYYNNIYDEKILLNSEYCEKKLIEELFKEKHKLDYVFDNNYLNLYIKARDSIFKKDKQGSKKFHNRAGDKILETLKMIDLDKELIKEHKEYFYFSSVADGPGSWVEVILKLVKNPVLGFGMTLLTKDIKGKSTLNWYPWLKNDERFFIDYGETGTGNIYLMKNILHFHKNIKEKTNNIMLDLSISDGGIEITKPINGIHYDTIQELLNNRLKLSEFFVGLLNLKENGYLISKIYDCFGDLMASILYIASIVFNKVYIVKPTTSRIVNSEKYLVCLDYHQNINIIKVIAEIISNSNKNNVPQFIINPSILHKDKIFIKSISNFNNNYMIKQIDALKKVNKKTYDLINNKNNLNRSNNIKNKSKNSKKSKK